MQLARTAQRNMGFKATWARLPHKIAPSPKKQLAQLALVADTFSQHWARGPVFGEVSLARGGHHFCLRRLLAQPLAKITAIGLQ